MKKQIQLFRPVYRTNEILKELKKTFDSGWTGLGPQTEIFERNVASYLNVKYAVMLNSATAGLHLAIKLLNIEPGKKVITTPLTFISTNHVLLYEQLRPVFCDIDSRTGCLDSSKVEELIDEDVKAIQVVHYGGTPCDMQKISDIARAYNIPIIQDCCHAFGSSCNNVKIGSSPDIHIFSFHSLKPLPVCDGGLITTQNRLYYERIKKLSWLGIDRSTYARTGETGYSWEYNVSEVGYKYHSNDILSTIAGVGLKYVEEDMARREEIVQMYREGLKALSWVKFVPDVQYMEEHPEIQSANHLCCIRIPRKPEFIERMKGRNIDVGCHYRPNTHYPMYWVDDKIQILKNTEKLYSEIITLPLHLRLTDKDIAYIIKSIKDVWD